MDLIGFWEKLKNAENDSEYENLAELSVNRLKVDITDLIQFEVKNCWTWRSEIFKAILKKWDEADLQETKRYRKTAKEGFRSLVLTAVRKCEIRDWVQVCDEIIERCIPDKFGFVFVMIEGVSAGIKHLEFREAKKIVKPLVLMMDKVKVDRVDEELNKMIFKNIEEIDFERFKQWTEKQYFLNSRILPEERKRGNQRKIETGFKGSNRTESTSPVKLALQKNKNELGFKQVNFEEILLKNDEKKNDLIDANKDSSSSNAIIEQVAFKPIEIFPDMLSKDDIDKPKSPLKSKPITRVKPKRKSVKKVKKK